MKHALFTFFLLGFLAGKGQNPELSSYDSLKKLPPINYYRLDGSTFTKHDLKKHRYLVFVYVKEGCPYCEKQVYTITSKCELFPKTQFYFISREDSSALKKFVHDHAVEDSPQTIMLWDKDKVYYKYTKAHFTPSIHIYDRKKRLLYFTDGLMTAKELAQYIR